MNLKQDQPFVLSRFIPNFVVCAPVHPLWFWWERRKYYSVNLPRLIPNFEGCVQTLTTSVSRRYARANMVIISAVA